jgi:hypothetical protein
LIMIRGILHQPIELDALMLGLIKNIGSEMSKVTR